ncbi:MAG: 3-phosphoserine/phosphohydroxythreonine transaminase, partial [Eggerthellales bacterium]|nr:3-phosphoserine/phosphohydroxythreonine transaminase [Eggerthellales bacterium]
FGEARVVASSADENFSYIPNLDEIEFSEDADYVYICDNETIYGTKYKKYPQVKAPLVADVSSCFLSEPMNVEDFGVIYGGAQKNIGPAGLTIVIIREDLIPTEDLPTVPSMLQYRIQADKGSMFNTPPCYAIYMAGKTFKWLKSLGGLEAIAQRNAAKAKLLYDFLDQSTLFKAPVRKEDRSLMNVPFVTGDADLDAKFVAEAKAAGLENLKGHRSVGGMRASIYNAMPVEGVEALVKFMAEFEAANL